MTHARRISVLMLLWVAAFAAATYAAVTNSDVPQILQRLESELAPDKRTAIWDVKAETLNNGTVNLSGTVTSRQMHQQLLQALSPRHINDRVNVLEDNMPQNKQWALVKLSVASLRTEPRHAAEMATQAVMGTPLRVLEKKGEWCRVQTPDRYISYVPESSITYLSQQQLDTWRNDNDRFIVTVNDAHLTADADGNDAVSDLVLGCILQKRAQLGALLLLSTPDGRCGYLPAKLLQPLNEWAQQPFDINRAISTAKSMMGAGYLWGGTSTKVTDCSGLTKIAYFSTGIILQRDASQQARTGTRFNDWHDCQTGDLLFFGNSNTKRVTHVGIYLDNGNYIHCSGQVKINNLNPNHPDYLYSPLSISRIDGMVGTDGITAVARHPWFFPQDNTTLSTL